MPPKISFSWICPWRTWTLSQQPVTCFILQPWPWVLSKLLNPKPIHCFCSKTSATDRSPRKNPDGCCPSSKDANNQILHAPVSWHLARWMVSGWSTYLDDLDAYRTQEVGNDHVSKKKNSCMWDVPRVYTMFIDHVSVCMHPQAIA